MSTERKWRSLILSATRMSVVSVSCSSWILLAIRISVALVLVSISSLLTSISFMKVAFETGGKTEVLDARVLFGDARAMRVVS